MNIKLTNNEEVNDWIKEQSKEGWDIEPIRAYVAEYPDEVNIAWRNTGSGESINCLYEVTE